MEAVNPCRVAAGPEERFGIFPWKFSASVQIN